MTPAPTLPLKHVDLAALASNPVERLAFLKAFVGFTPADQRALTDSLPVLGPALPDVLDALYDHLLSWDDTRRVFFGDGEYDELVIELRKEHLTRWVVSTASMTDAKELTDYVRRVAHMHVARPSTRVAPRYMVGLMGFLQGAVWSALFELLPKEPQRVRAAGLAWSKMLIIQLELFLQVMAPAWPAWDEAHEPK